MSPTDTLLLTRREVASLLSIEECIQAVEGAFRLHGNGEASPPGILGMHAADGGFHIKAGMLNLGKKYFVAKTNANFPNNGKRFGLPTIQGIIVVCDGENGRLLSLMDSIEITVIRTGAATAVAAKYLARPGAKIVTICGCGNQGKISLRALMKVRPVENAFAFDIDKGLARQFAREMSQELKISVIAVDDLSKAVKQSHICVTCTPSKEYFLRQEDIAPGTFIAAVGADSEDKQELEPEIMVTSKLVVDVTEQCATIGELHHALQKGLVTRADVYAELGEIIAGRKPGRTSDQEVIVFDSTGMALQDVASAAIVFEKAIKNGIGLKMNFAE